MDYRVSTTVHLTGPHRTTEAAKKAVERALNDALKRLHVVTIDGERFVPVSVDSVFLFIPGDGILDVRGL